MLQLGHMQVCTSLQTDNHASTPPLRTENKYMWNNAVSLVLKKTTVDEMTIYRTSLEYQQKKTKWPKPQIKSRTRLNFSLKHLKAVRIFHRQQKCFNLFYYFRKKCCRLRLDVFSLTTLVQFQAGHMAVNITNRLTVTIYSWLTTIIWKKK